MHSLKVHSSETTERGASQQTMEKFLKKNLLTESTLAITVLAPVRRETITKYLNKGRGIITCANFFISHETVNICF